MKVVNKTRWGRYFQPGGRSVYRPTKVGNFDLSVETNQQIFKLQIPVDDFVGVTVHKCVSKLCHIISRPINTKPLKQWKYFINDRAWHGFSETLIRLGFQKSVHLAIESVLQNEKNAGLIVKVSIQSQDVRVPVRKYYKCARSKDMLLKTLNYSNYQYFKRVCISISLLNWSSIPPFLSWDRNKIFKATMNFEFISLAR